MAKGTVRCVSGIYKDMYVAVNVFLLVPIYLPLFVCADIDVNVCKKKKKEQSCGESKMTFRARMAPECQDFVFKLRCHVSHWPLTDACIYSGDKWHTPTASWLSSPRTSTQVSDVRAPPTACCWRLNLKNRGSSDQGLFFFFYFGTEIWRKSVQMEHQVCVGVCVCTKQQQIWINLTDVWLIISFSNIHLETKWIMLQNSARKSHRTENAFIRESD